MIGTIAGDIIGSVYEFNNIKTKDFVLFKDYCEATDDSILTIAVADAIMEYQDTGYDFRQILVEKFVDYCTRYPHPMGGYGGKFNQWIYTEHHFPYYSCGNGSAMRVAACGYAAKTVEEARELAKMSAMVTHNHPDGIAGAQAVAEAIYLGKNGYNKSEIEEAVKQYYPNIPDDIEWLQVIYGWGAVCSNTVPEAIACFLQSNSFEDAIRNAISIGGDSDTVGAIVGGIAGAYYGVPEEFSEISKLFLDDDLLCVVEEFERRYMN